jgi:hypothetical protein
MFGRIASDIDATGGDWIAPKPREGVIRIKATWMPDQFVNTPHERSTNVEKLLADLGDYGDEIVSVTPVGDGSVSSSSRDDRGA